jgi:hypothetical protein
MRPVAQGVSIRIGYTSCASTDDGSTELSQWKVSILLRSRIRIGWLVVEDATAAYKNTGECKDGRYKSQETPNDFGKQAESPKM